MDDTCKRFATEHRGESADLALSLGRAIYHLMGRDTWATALYLKRLFDCGRALRDSIYSTEFQE